MYALTLNQGTLINVFAAPGDAVTSVTGATAKGTRVISGVTYTRYDTARIAAGNLGRTYEIKLTSASGEAIVKMSAMSYVDTVLNSSAFSEAKQYAMTAYYRYYAAAIDYRNQ